MNAYDLKQVTQYFGSKKALAKVLGIAPQAIYQWKHRIPIRRALEIEKLTNGLFRADHGSAASSFTEHEG